MIKCFFSIMDKYAINEEIYVLKKAKFDIIKGGVYRSDEIERFMICKRSA